MIQATKGLYFSSLQQKVECVLEKSVGIDSFLLSHPLSVIENCFAGSIAIGET